jgi:hypothetical protein
MLALLMLLGYNHLVYANVCSKVEASGMTRVARH